jgi:non-ribosomal peptide synthetase component F
MALLAAFTVLMARYSGQEDVVVGTANGNRPQVETERMLGLFVNTMVVRADLSGDPSFRELLARVRKRALEDYTHGDLPFEKLVEELRPPRDLSRSPIFQVLFVIQNTPLEALARGAVSGVIGERGTAAYDLSLYLIETGRGFSGSLEYNTDLFDRATVRRFSEHYEHLLAGIVAHPESSISELPLLGAAERCHILQEWNDTARTLIPSGVHEMFETQAKRTPDAVALDFGGQTLAYDLLDMCANALAWRLRELGVRPGALVALHADRSIEMMIGLLGILKAGGAYVPLDPAYPRERLALMLEDARPTVVLTERRLTEGLPPSRAHRVLLDEASLAGDARVAPPEGGAGPEDLAYVIFTSGSTGRPKGVAVPHRALTNLLVSMREAPGLSEADVLLAVTTLAFDIAGLELFLPLTVGARVVLSSREVAADGPALAQLLIRSGASVMQATPATWRMLIATGWKGDPRLKVLCGGEALPSELAQ